MKYTSILVVAAIFAVSESPVMAIQLAKKKKEDPPPTADSHAYTLYKPNKVNNRGKFSNGGGSLSNGPDQSFDEVACHRPPEESIKFFCQMQS